jgi:endonuclease III
MRKSFEVDFSIDDLKAIKIAGRLYNQFYTHQGFFADYSMPEYVPARNLKEGSREHALFLTYVISIDYMTDAVRLWKRSRGAFELHPDMFTPKQILKVSPRTVENFVKKLGARYYTNAAKTWINISRVLAEKYDEDPRNLTKEPLTIAEVKQRLKDFPYLRGNKLTNLYIRAMGETGLLKVKDFEDLDIPVDKQVARFTIYTGVLKLMSEQFVGCAQDSPLRGLIEEAWRNAAKTLGTAPWKLDEPIWTVGSKLCSDRKCGQCSVEDLCDKTKGITFKENTVIWNKKDKKDKEADQAATTLHGTPVVLKKPVHGHKGYVVFEDLARATGPKVHHINCVYHAKWLKNPTTTTKWHGPYETEEEAWEVCRAISSKSEFEPSCHRCVRQSV